MIRYTAVALKQENESKRRRERKVKKRGSKEAKQETKLSRQLSGTDSPVQGEITNAELKFFVFVFGCGVVFLFSLFLRVDVSVSSVDVSVNKPDRFMSLLAFSAELYNCTCTIAWESVL